MIPIGTDYQMRRTPWVNYLLLAANILIFLMGFHADSQEARERIDGWMLDPDDPVIQQFFSSVFLHADITHLLGNMVFLWVFGNALNDRFGHVAYLAFYLAGGVIAGVGYLLLSGNAPVLGASGAIAGVSGAYLVLLPRVRVRVLLIFYFITVTEVSSLLFVLFHFIYDLFMTMHLARRGGGGVAYAAHSAGYVFGIITAVAMLALKLLPRDAFDLLNLIRHRHRRAKFRRMAAQGFDAFNPVSNRVRKPGDESKRWVRSRSERSESSDSLESRELELRKEISAAFGRHDLPAAASTYLRFIQIADNGVLPRQQQLDVANQLMASEQHAAAADAYERFLKHYPNYEHLADIYLMLGLLYFRYLLQYDRAEPMLVRAAESLQDPKKVSLAREELRRLRSKR